MNFDIKVIVEWLRAHIAPISAETLGWLSVIFLHAATVPTLIAILTGLSDRMPPVDLVLMVWAGLMALFAQAAVQRNLLIMITVTLGFVLQAGLMALIFFK